MLALVAPTSMSADQQTFWLASAVDALEDIRASEVAAVSAEIRRSVTRHNQIIPEIAKLVGERRKRKPAHASRPCGCGEGQAPSNDRTDIHWVEREGSLTIEFCCGPTA